MFHLALQQLDFVGSEAEEAIDAVVEFGFSGGELAGEAVVFAALLLEIRLPFVGGPRVLQRVRGQLEALFERVAKLVQRQFLPRLRLLIELAGGGGGKGLHQSALEGDLPRVTRLPGRAKGAGEVRDGLPLGFGSVGNRHLFPELRGGAKRPDATHTVRTGRRVAAHGLRGGKAGFPAPALRG